MDRKKWLWKADFRIRGGKAKFADRRNPGKKTMIKMKKITLILTLLGLCMGVEAQKANWQNLDLQKDSVFGISTEKAYGELLHHKKATTVLVAVIDGGVDTAHEDLKAVIWNNPREKAYNGKDDD